VVESKYSEIAKMPTEIVIIDKPPSKYPEEVAFIFLTDKRQYKSKTSWIDQTTDLVEFIESAEKTPRKATPRIRT
jgi:hypothetical protein